MFIRQLIILSVLVLTFNSVKAQRFSQGIQINLPVASMMHFDQNYILPQNYNYIYMVNSPLADWQRENWFNVLQGFGRRHKNLGGGIGYMIKLSLGRYGLRFGYRLKYNCSVVKLNHFSDNIIDDELVDNYKAVFYTQLFQHQYPLAITFNLRRENDAPFLLLGVEPGYIFGKIEKESWSNGIFTDRIKVPFLAGHLYNEKPYLSMNMGYGFRKKQFEFDFVFKFYNTPFFEVRQRKFFKEKIFWKNFFFFF